MDKLIKASVAVVVMLVGISVSYYFFVALPAIQKQRLAIQASAARVEQDQKCSRGAKALFDDSQWSEKDSGAWYENHFNSKLNRCFIFVRSNISEIHGVALGDVNYEKVLLDVNDGTTVAEYDKEVRLSYAAPKQLTCEIRGKDCQNEDEFDAFVKTYMEQ